MVGRVLDGRYRVGPRVARGGMAVVYEATDLRLDRTVAVKIMHAGLADDDEFVSRFEREARHAAKLAHHNVVAVFDQGDDQGTLFLVMEYVPGLTLRDLIRKEAPMSPAKALAVLEPVLSALSAAHGSGMIHRDVKPENVLLADDGRIKVADFGLARAVNSETHHTATGGVLIGTVSYLAPELVVDGKADARADVYAAGVLLYEMLTGRKPHQADSPIQIAYKHVHEDVPPPSDVVPGIPAYVDALVARATARDRSMRPADARVLQHQVRRVRNALDHGVVDDPELTSDLVPTAPVGEAAEVAAPATLARQRDTDDVYDQDLEHTPLVGPRLRTQPLIQPPPPKDPPTSRRERRRRGPLLLALLLVVALLVGLGGWWFGFARYTSTPGVLEMNRTAAAAKVEKAGLHFRVSGTSYSETTARGSVVSTDPKPGARVLKDGTVSAVLSLGPERHKVPDLRGKTLDHAQAALQDAHLGFGRAVGRWSSSMPRGLVLATDPPANTSLHRDAAVDVIISRGPRPITIPDFTGRSAKAAEKRLGKLGFTVDASDTEFSDTVAKGTVISQDPSSGTGHKGDAITLVVSKGPELVTVPDVVRSGLSDAQATLEAAGFQVKVQQAQVYIGLQYVVREDPSGGSKRPRGSTVTLTIV
jgi:serine/threonine-protein kinase